YESAHAVSVEECLEKPWLLKALSLGNRRDVDVMDKILQAYPNRLVDVWSLINASDEKNGQGYNRSPNLMQKEDSCFIADLPDCGGLGDCFSFDSIEFEQFFERYGE